MLLSKKQQFLNSFTQMWCERVCVRTCADKEGERGV